MTSGRPTPQPGLRRRAAALSALVLAGLLLVAGPAALGAEDSSKVTIRRIDATESDAVKVTVAWDGERSALARLAVREDGELRSSEAPVPRRDAGARAATVIAIDVSGSMSRDGSLEVVKTGLERVVADLVPGEAMGIVAFGDDAIVESEVTTDRAALGKAIAGLSAPPNSRTALWDGVGESAQLLTGLENREPRFVLITDGFDDSSERTQAQALAALASTGAPAVGVAYGEAKELEIGEIQSVVDRAGGKLIEAPKRADLLDAMGDLAAAIDNEYVVTYASEATRGATDLEVSVGADEDRKTFVVGTDAAGQANLASPDVTASKIPGILRSDVGKYLAIALAALAVGLGVLGFGLLAGKDESSLDAVLASYTEPGGGADGDENDGALAQTAILQRAVSFTERLAERQGILTKIEQKLERADLPLRAAEGLFFYIAAATIITVLGLVLGGLTGMLLAAMLGFILPRAILNFLARRRQKAFTGQLPDTLSLLSGSLRAGYSLVQGVDAVSVEVAEPMGKELRRVMTENRLGRDLEESLEATAERMKSPDFDWAVMAIRIQREVGGNLAELLMTVSETMISRERLRRDVASLTAEGKISAIVLGFLPVGLGAVMYVVNPDYMGVLFSRTVGRGMLAAGVVMALVGFAWMKKTITIEV